MKIYDEMLEISNETLDHSQGLKNILDEYKKEKPSVVAESMSEGLPIIEFIDERTELGNALRDFYEMNNEVLEEKVNEFGSVDCRNGHGFCFVHSVNYSWIDKDLLGGNGDGKRQKEFEEFVCMREHEKYKELDRQTSIDSPAKESVNAKKRADEKNASRQGLNKNKSKGQRNR